jgi:DNA polymerase-3 subunit alpha
LATKITKLTNKDYVHLHNHTQYSLLDGLTKIPALIDYVGSKDMEAVAITDHGTLSGVIELYKEAKSKDIKPIIGIETYIAARSFTDKEPSKDKPNFHLILLAMDNKGYQNLMALSTIANLEGFYYKPRIDKELLSKHNEGLICLSGCASSELGEALRNGFYDEAKKIAEWYKGVFGDRYYIEIQDHGHPKHTSVWSEQTRINEGLFKLAEELDIPAVVTCDAHYLKHADQDAHEILLCVQTASFLSDEKRMSLKDFELHVTDPSEVIGRWGEEHPELITNTKKIADRCNVEIELGKILIPKFPVPKGESERSYLETLVYRGLAWRYSKTPKDKAMKLSKAEVVKVLDTTAIERAEYELSVIDQMNFNGYFLIIHDFINWGKDQGIAFGPGRGSAAGSIVSYALNITEIDPLKYNLMFERFLNPHRISMPDVDIDIQDSRRDEVIEYCVNKYGKERVANIVTFGRMAARNAVRDVARVMQVPYAEADRLAKMIPGPVQGRHIPLKQSLKEDIDLKNEYDTNETSKKVFDLAIKLEGTVRSHGIHAAGVVIAPEDIVYYTPLEMAQKGVIATQYSMGPIEELGLLKMDFLGLSNLTILSNALRIIKRVYNDDIELAKVPNDDPGTFELFQSGNTIGVFQFESAGMKRYLRELKPNEFEDLIAMNALYRPGPLSEIPKFIEGKNNQSAVRFLHESLEPILKDTYGVMVYQEQIIQLLQLVAGYSAGEADLVRKAIGKKKRDIMTAEEPKFIEGCIKQGLTSSQAKTLWAQIQPFADYSFNKAHATCYAQIAYWTAYLKAHYPDAFMAALMTSDLDDTDRLAVEIGECKKMDLTVLPPDINESYVGFSIVPEKNQIRFGMAAIKNVGTAVVEEIEGVRKDKPFDSLDDFLTRCSSKVVNRKTMESLIKAGAFDAFSDRSTLLFNLDTILAYTSRLHKQNASGQIDMFGGEVQSAYTAQLDLAKPTEELSPHEQLTWERELLGLYLSQHPLDTYQVYLSEKSVALKDIKPDHDGQSVSVGGNIADIREITTKNGQKMAFVRLEDYTGETEIVLFPGSYEKFQHLWIRDKVVLIKGKVSAKDKDGKMTDEPKIMVNDAQEITLDMAKRYKPKNKAPKLKETVAAMPGPGAKAVSNEPINPKVYIRLVSSDDQNILLNLKQTIDAHQGPTDVVLVLGDAEKRQAIKLPQGINHESEGIEELRILVGTDNLVLR